MTFHLTGAIIIAYSMNATFLLPIQMTPFHLYGHAGVAPADVGGTLVAQLAQRAMAHARLPSQTRPDLT